MAAEDPITAPPGLTQRALGGMLWTFSGTGLQLLAQLLVLMALGRLLTPAEFGFMGAVAVVIAFSQIVSQLGVGQAMIQRRELRPIHIRVAVTLSSILGCLLGVAVYLGAPAIARFYRMPEIEPLLRGVAFLFPLDAMSTVSKALLSRTLRFRLLVSVEVASYILGFGGVGVALAASGFGVWSLVWANLSQVALRTLGMYAVTRHTLRPSLNLEASGELLRFGLGLSLAQIGTVLSQQGDNIVVGRYLGPMALGIYGRAYNLMVMPAGAFGKIVNRVLFPVMAQVQHQPDRLAGGYERALAIVALVALPISAFLWVVAPEFIPVLLGPAWTGVVLPFRLFTVGLLFRMSSKISDVLANAAGAVYAQALLQGAYAVMVVLGAIIGQRWGVGGVAVAVSVAMGINCLAMAALSRSLTGLAWDRYLSAQVPGAMFALLILAAVSVVVYAARAAQVGAVPTLLVAALTAAAVVYAAARMWSNLFLGVHGAWAWRQAEGFLRERLHSRRLRRSSGFAKANPK